MPIKISDNEIRQILQKTADEQINATLEKSGSCLQANSIVTDKGCTIKNAEIDIYTCLCPLGYKKGSEESSMSYLNSIKNQQITDISQRLSHRSGFPLFPGTSVAKNIADASASARSDVTTSIFNDCNTSEDLINSVICKNSNIDNLYIKESGSGEELLSCVSKNLVTDSTSQDIKSSIAQSTVNHQQNTLYIWEGILFLVTISVVALLLLEGDLPLKLRLALVIVVIIIALFALYYLIKYYDKKEKVQWCPDCTKYTDQVECEGALCYWDGSKCSCDGTKLDCTTQCTNFFNKTDCKRGNCYWTGSECTGAHPCKAPIS